MKISRNTHHQVCLFSVNLEEGTVVRQKDLIRLKRRNLNRPVFFLLGQDLRGSDQAKLLKSRMKSENEV
jgi:hypothetical protein